MKAILFNSKLQGRKNVYRIFDKQGYSLIDLLTKAEGPQQLIDKRFLCRDPFAVIIIH